jgi:hypothetical protein
MLAAEISQTRGRLILIEEPAMARLVSVAPQTMAVPPRSPTSSAGRSACASITF